MNERLKERIQNFAEAVRTIGAETPLPATDKGIRLLPDIRRDGLIPPLPDRDGIRTLPDIRRDGLEPDFTGAMQFIRDIEALGGRLSDAEKSMYMNMTPEGIQQVRERENIDQMLNSMIEGTLEKPKNIFDEELKNMSFEDGVELSRKLNRKLSLLNFIKKIIVENA